MKKHNWQQNFVEAYLVSALTKWDKIFTPEIARPRVKRNTDYWGYGVRVVADEGRVLPIGSYGWSGMYGSHFWIDPSNKIIGIYMKNSRFDGGSGAKTSRNFEKDVYFCLSEK